MNCIASLRRLAAFALAIVITALALLSAALAPASAYAYSSDDPGNAIGKVSCQGSNPRTYYGTSVSDVMHIIDDMTSSTHNPWQVSEFTVDLLADWNSNSYGVIKFGNFLTVTLNLNGHMINRDKTTTDGKFDGSGNGEVVRVGVDTKCTINGGDTNVEHFGKLVDSTANGKFWKYDPSGSDVLNGGLITGGAVDDQDAGGGITAYGSSELVLNNVTVAGNVSDTYLTYNGQAGGIYTRGSITLNSSKVMYNHAESSGGGIMVMAVNMDDPCKICLSNSEVSYNTALERGGGIFAVVESKSTEKAGKLYVIEIKNGSEISHNIAKEEGGGICTYNYGAGGFGVKLSDYSEVSNNKAQGDGGGIAFVAASISKGLEMDSTSSIKDNRADGDGGGIWSGQEFYLGDGSSTGTWDVDGTISGNSAGGDGGGVCFGSSGESALKQEIEFGTVHVKSNSAGGDGGGIAVLGARGISALRLGCWSSFEGNAAEGNGGAIYIDAVIDLKGSGGLTFKGNIAGANGGALFSESNDCNINFFNANSRSTFENNKARYNGGAIAINHSTSYSLHVVNASFTGNAAGTTSEATGCGGAIWFKKELYLEDVTVENNNSTGKGGGIYCDNDSYYSFELAKTVKITGNKIVARSDDGVWLSELGASNLSVKGEQDVCGASGDRALTTDSLIGFTVEGYDGSNRRVSGNQAFLTEGLGDWWRSCVFSDNEQRSIVRNGNYLYLSNEAPKYTLSVYATNATPITSEHKAGEIVELDGKDYAWTVTEGGVQKEVKPSFWNVAYADGTTQVVMPNDNGIARFVMGKGATTVRARYAEPLVSAFAGISEFSSWDSLVSGPVDSGDASAYVHYTALTGAWGSNVGRGESVSKTTAKVVSRQVEEVKADSGNYVSSKKVTYTLTMDAPKVMSDGLWIKDGYEVSAEFENILKSFSGEPKTTAQGTLTKVENNVMTFTYTVEVENPNKNYCTVTFNANGGTLPSGTDATRTLVSGSAIGDLPVPAKDGCKFDGWYDVQDNRVTPLTVINGDATLTAHWIETAEYRSVIVLDTDGTTIDAGTVKVGEAIARPTAVPVKEGYAFKDWYADKDCTRTFDFNAKIAEGSEPIYIYAGWTKENYKVTFELAGGEGEIETLQTVDYGDKVEEPHESPVRAGYMFLGWYAGSELYDFDLPVKGNLKLVAAWEINTYPVYFDKCDGSAVEEQVLAYGSFVTKPADPTRTGYAFKGWYLDKACTQEYDFTSFVTAPLRLYAKWEAGVTVTLDPANGMDAETRIYAVGDILGDLPHPLYENHVFDGWYSGDIKVNEQTEVAGDMSLVAKWLDKTYTVRFDTGGGSAVDDQYVSVEGGKAQKPQDPTRAGYDFGGWFADDVCTDAFDFDAVITGNTTVYAKWIAQGGSGYSTTCKVSFDSAGGSEVDTQSVQSGKKAVKPQDPTREGYTFAGWMLDDEQYDFDKAVTGDITLVAVWDKNPVDISAAQVTLSKKKLAYNGKRRSVTVKSVVLGGKTLEPGVDYEASIKRGKKVGSYQVVACGMGEYTGQLAASYKIVPAKVKKLKAKTSGAKSVKLGWAKHKKQTSGFRVRWAASKAALAKGKNASKATLKKAAAKACVVTDLKSGKRYYFQVRAYKVVDGKRYYSAWSKIVSAKTK